MEGLTTDALRALMEKDKVWANESTRCKRKGCAARAVELDFVTRNGPEYIECSAEDGNCGCAHAEACLLAGFIEQKLHAGWKMKSFVLATTLPPCVHCAYWIIHSGLVRAVVYLDDHSDKRGRTILQEYGIPVLHVRDPQNLRTTLLRHDLADAGMGKRG